jgi:serine/threonine protein kinase
MAELFGDFLLIKRLALGAWSELWVAQPRYAEGVGHVVIKRLLPSMARRKDAIAMLEGEGLLASRLDHRHVVTSSALLETEDGYSYLVQPYVDGTNLSKLLAYRARVRAHLPLHLRVFIAASTAGGLSHAHTRCHPADGEHMAIIHRDLTPANLLVGLDGLVRVTDFGIARGRGRKKTTNIGQVRGTLAYMAPEQAMGGAIDHRIDIYALGVVFWELLAGRRLYPDLPDFSVLSNITHEIPPPPSQFDSEVDSDLDSFVYRCLQKNRDDRFKSAADLRDLLYQWLDADEPALRNELSEWLSELSKASRSGAYRSESAKP